MKTRVFSLFAVMAVLAILAIALPAAPTHASTDNQVQIQATIMSLPATGGLLGRWTVGTYTVHVKSNTQIDQTDGKAQVGATVCVEGYFKSDGSIRATSIDVLAAPSGQ